MRFRREWPVTDRDRGLIVDVDDDGGGGPYGAREALVSVRITGPNGGELFAKRMTPEEVQELATSLLEAFMLPPLRMTVRPKGSP